MLGMHPQSSDLQSGPSQDIDTTCVMGFPASSQFISTRITHAQHHLGKMWHAGMLGRRITWVASIMHCTGEDHREHLQVGELRHEAVLRKEARKALYHVCSMRAVVVWVARLVGCLDLLHEARGA